MMRWVTVIALLLLVLPLDRGRAETNSAQPSMSDFTKMCETAPCRRNVEFSLKKRDGTYFTYKTPLAPPVVQPAFISVYPGETLSFEADETPDSKLSLRLVTSVVHPEKTITMSLFQARQIGDGTGMQFIFKNPLGHDVRYHLGIMSLTDERVLPTSTCPVLKGIFGVEYWPYPLFQVIVTNVGVMKQGDPRTCEN